MAATWMVEEGQLSFTASWETELEEQDQADWEERETRWVGLNRHEEHREQQVKGEQCRDLGGSLRHGRQQQ